MEKLMSKALVDSSFLYSLYNLNDNNHNRAITYSQQAQDTPLVPDVVLPEVTYLFRREGGVPAVTAFLRLFAIASVETVALTKPDIQRAESIMSGYASAKLDFVDCAIMALPERLNVQKIATFDRRDFSMVRPAHCDYFELLP